MRRQARESAQNIQTDMYLEVSMYMHVTIGLPRNLSCPDCSRYGVNKSTRYGHSHIVLRSVQA